MVTFFQHWMKQIFKSRQSCVDRLHGQYETMDIETCINDGDIPYFHSSESVVHRPSEEHMMLIELCSGLSAMCNCNDEPLNTIDETRQEAKLLMSLMRSNESSSSLSVDGTNKQMSLERVSSDQSLMSDQSTSSTAATRRNKFSFVCPSLSLDNSSSHSYLRDICCEVSEVLDLSSPCLPVHLLQRTLKVDDRDALRLSADAIARNVLRSFQTAMDVRIQSWINVLSKKIVQYEHRMLRSGSSIEGLKVLLRTPEALLIAALRQLRQERGVSTESVMTSFEVLSQRIESHNDLEDRLHQTASSSSSCNSSVSSDEITSSNTEHSVDDGETYSYVVTHQLRFCCTVHLQALVGFTEISITVPGTIAGCFESSELDPTTELKSVTVDLETSVLASMIDKASRSVVRSSVEKIISQPIRESKAHDEVSNDTNAVTTPDACVPTMNDASYLLTSPPPMSVRTRADSVFVTPGPLSDDSNHSIGSSATLTNKNILLPVPDDFTSRTDAPRRISPQPMLRNSDSTTINDDDAPILTSFKRRSSTSSSSSSQAIETDSFNLTTTTKKQRRVVVPLISPQPSQQNTVKYHVPDNGPSLPMLVEAACRVISLDSTNLSSSTTVTK